ncbi:hypothetical protein [Actinoplanes sp. NPDC049265]|uniref:hypothetical protein n=1 Tax=Actinoplanes sp. NPDC049265 TaxID=3363902 RepID=UPI00371E8E13
MSRKRALPTLVAILLLLGGGSGRPAEPGAHQLRILIGRPGVEKAADLPHRNPASAAGAAKGKITLMTPYARTAAGQPLGAIDRTRVTNAIAVLVDTGLMPPGLTADKVAEFPLTPR